MAHCSVVSSPAMNRTPVKARISPPSKAVQERLIKQCMQRAKTQRRSMIEASRMRGLGVDGEQEIFRGLLYEQLQQEEQQQDRRRELDQNGGGVAEAEAEGATQVEVDVEEDELDEADELVQALGRDNYDEFMIWLEQGLRAELEMMEKQQFEEEVENELEELERFDEQDLNVASQLTEIAQDEFVLCPQCKEHPLRPSNDVYSCECGLSLPSAELSIEELRFLLRRVLDNHRQTCVADVTFQQHKELLYAYCWDCGLVEPVCAAFEQR